MKNFSPVYMRRTCRRRNFGYAIFPLAIKKKRISLIRPVSVIWLTNWYSYTKSEKSVCRCLIFIVLTARICLRNWCSEMKFRPAPNVEKYGLSVEYLRPAHKKQELFPLKSGPVHPIMSNPAPASCTGSCSGQCSSSSCLSGNSGKA